MTPFRPPAPPAPDAWPSRLLLFGAVLATLWLGREVLAPLALALLLTIAAMPVVEWLERRGLPRIAAVLLVLLLILGLLGGLVSLVVGQALSLAAALPKYESVLRAKLAEISPGSGPIEGVVQLVRRLGAAFVPAEAAPAATVVVAPAAEGPLQALAGIALPVLAPVATIGITLLLMALLLIHREDVRDRVLRLAGLETMHRTTGAMADATARVGRYLLMQVTVNALFGVTMGLGLWLLGVPNAPLWGALGFLLRFVPFLGAPLSMVFPVAIAFATTQGWATVLLVVALFGVVDLVATYGLEPWLYGSSTGVTPLALVLSSAFWAVLWGPLGLILSPAITACLVILGRHAPAFGFLDVLLGDSEPLPAPARFYQRLLAEDAAGAGQVLAAEAGRAGSLAAMEALVLPAIARLGTDRGSETFGPALTVSSARTLLQVLHGLGEDMPGPVEILVLPVAGALDRAAAAAVAVALQDAGHAVGLGPLEGRVALAVLVAAEPPSPRRLQRALAGARPAAGAVIAFAASAPVAQTLARSEPSLAPATSLPDLLAEVEARQVPAAA